jgi:hypothetical protein
VQEECIVSNREVDVFSFVVLVDRTSLVIHRMISTTEDTSDITRSFFSVALVCQMVTRTFYASWFEMAITFGVPISLTVCTLSNISFVFGRFELYFALLYIFYIEYVLVIRGRLQFFKNMESGCLVLYCLMFQIFVAVCPSFSISVLIYSGLME